ncbi:LysR family transcriptional regulator [Paraliomyxa miuraensis]|uniref:LysR family transcriptional regulator n=1 Tax=Paraliomyxa miuraensis TaxID=376150 RepID=UPI0022599A37|nr:LysR family transcriptional regulator [Paraliomyxa miuraensis]MCX4247366.1 LysR family transcriptional regulator [Paraliomyxa miuraensis]
MELEQLRAFVGVVEHGSLLTASKAMRISRTTLHSRISALEEGLGRELLVRTSRGVLPTEVGRELAEGARRLLADAEALAQSAAHDGDRVLGRLRLCAAVGFPPQLAMALTSQLARRHPELEIAAEVTGDPCDDPDPDADVIVHFGPAVPKGPFRTFALTHVQERLLASRRYLEEHGRPQSLEALCEHRLLSWRPPGEDGRRWPLCDGSTLEVSPAVVSNDVLVVRGLAATGQGIARVPDAALGFGPGVMGMGDALETVMADEVGRRIGVWVLLPETRADTPRSRAAARLLRELAAGLARGKRRGTA